jgi:single-stranded DNA-specific DHH superfamily exonuclease
VADLLDGLLEQGESQLDRKCMFFMLDNDTDAEITGLIGNKLLAMYQRPLFILRLINGQYAGSMRSVGTDNFLQIANDTGLCLCQGHPNAAGASIKENEFAQFKDVIEDKLKDVELVTALEADIEIVPEQVTDNLIKRLNALNRISGSGFKSINVLIRTDDYTVGCMSKGKHIKITDNKTGMIFVKWNDGSYKEIPKSGELVGIGTLSTAYYGRTRYTQCVMNDYVVNTTK